MLQRIVAAVTYPRRLNRAGRPLGKYQRTHFYGDIDDGASVDVDDGAKDLRRR